MLKKFLALALGASLWASPEERPLWIAHHDFVKLASKEAYEKARASQVGAFKEFTAPKTPYMVCFEDSASNQYISLYPVDDFSDVGALRKKFKTFRSSLAVTERFDALLAFQIETLLHYLPECSYGNLPMQKASPAHFTIYTLVPGGEEPFEQALIQKVGEALRSQSETEWRIWKVIFGTELPKYVVASFGKQIDLDMVKGVIRRERKGKAVFKPRLSLIDGD